MDGQTTHRPRADDHPAPRRRWFIVLVVVIVLGAATGAAALGLGGRHRPVAHADVLCVPSAALVALAEGGYGLEVEGGTYLPVQIGLFAQGKVEVRGAAIHDGLRIQSPVGD